LDFADAAHDLVEADALAVQPSGGQGGERFAEMKRIDLVEGQLAALEIVEEFGIGATAGTERFDCERTRAGLAKMGEQQAGENGLADAGVGAGDEDDSWLHVLEVLTTDFADDTDKLQDKLQNREKFTAFLHPNGWKPRDLLSRFLRAEATRPLLGYRGSRKPDLRALHVSGS
jgi:hypothetical protein